MGLFAIFFSIVIVIIQATSLLLQREAHQWTFSLVRNEPNLSHVQRYNELFVLSNVSTFEHANSGLVDEAQLKAFVFSYEGYEASAEDANGTVRYSATNRQIACMQTHWKQSAPGSKIPTHCFFNTHFNQKIEPILKAFNPHIILFVLCCIHATFCISKLKSISKSSTTKTYPTKRYESEEDELNRDAKVPFYLSLNYASFLMLVLIVAVFAVQGVENSELVEYPTIVTSVILLLSGIWYVANFPKHREDYEWINAFHLQVTAVPIAILVIATLGTRIWSDVVAHAVIMTAAVNILWLENQLAHRACRRFCQLVCIFLPCFSLYLAYMQWGQFDNWKYAVALMAYACFAPFIIYPIVSSSKSGETELKTKSFGKMTLFFTSASLISVVVNFAMFVES